jgi:hypothetical protein
LENSGEVRIVKLGPTIFLSPLTEPADDEFFSIAETQRESHVVGTLTYLSAIWQQLLLIYASINSCRYISE